MGDIFLKGQYVLELTKQLLYTGYFEFQTEYGADVCFYFQLLFLKPFTEWSEAGIDAYTLSSVHQQSELSVYDGSGSVFELDFNEHVFFLGMSVVGVHNLFKYKEECQGSKEIQHVHLERFAILPRSANEILSNEKFGIVPSSPFPLQ